MMNKKSNLTSYILYILFHLNPPIIIAGLQIRVCTGKLFFLFLNQDICCRYSKELSRYMFKLMGMEINAILGAQTILIWTYVIGGFK